jgi:glycerol kinase
MTAAKANSFILAIDQGTTSTRAVIFDEFGQSIGSSSWELQQYYPHPGWVEHDPEEIWLSVEKVVPQALAAAHISANQVAGIGLTNQRETCIVWDRENGIPLGRAIVWQDRRTIDFCRQHQADEPWIFQQTGLVLDPYFSATKLRWMLDQDPSRRHRAEAGQLAAGTIDSFLIWRMTGEKVFATDRTNASRTLLLDLKTASWDEKLCRYFDIPLALLPEVRPSVGSFGGTQGLTFLPDGIPISGVAGDQQAALAGQLGFEVGDAKCTYGTGAFYLLHTGPQLVQSSHRLLTTIAASAGNPVQYALEGSVFIAGAAVQWLRDGLKVIETSPDVESLAERADSNQPVIFVPGLVGLGAPYWVPEAKGVLFGLTRGTTAAEIARATLEGVAFQVSDLVDAAGKDSGQALETLRVDGGMARNVWFLQSQADLLGIPVLQARECESTARGAALLAGLGIGFWPHIHNLSHLENDARVFQPRMSAKERISRLAQWKKAVKSVIDFYQS